MMVLLVSELKIFGIHFSVRRFVAPIRNPHEICRYVPCVSFSSAFFVLSKIVRIVDSFTRIVGDKHLKSIDHIYIALSLRLLRRDRLIESILQLTTYLFHFICSLTEC